MRRPNLSLREFYSEFCKESHTTGDFPFALATVIQAQLTNLFDLNEETQFERWMRETEVTTFREEDRISLTNMGLLERRKELEAAKDTTLSEVKYKVKAETFARKLTISREMVVNDVLNAFSDMTNGFVSAARATQAVESVNLLVNAGTAYDGFPFYQSVGDRVNVSTYSEPTGGAWKASFQAANTLKDAIIKMQQQKDPYRPDRYVGKPPTTLVVAPTFVPNIRILLSAETVIDGAEGAEVPNPVRGLLSPESVVSELRLDDLGNPKAVYLVADPNALPAFEMAYLRNVRGPQVYVKEPSLRAISGTPNPQEFDYPFNDLSYEVQFDFGVNLAEPRAAYRVTCLS